MYNLLINIYSSIHNVESRLNHLECKYPDIIREDDVNKIYNMLAELGEEANALGNLVDTFLQLNPVTLETIGELITKELKNNNNEQITRDLMLVKNIVDKLVKFKK